MFNPAGFPDGTRLAFYGGHDESLHGVYTMCADGSHLLRVAPAAPAALDSEPQWSPRGDTIAVSSNCLIGGVTPDVAPGCSEGSATLSVFDPRGGHRRVLVVRSGQFSDPVWSPDGARLAFTWESNATYRIYTIGVDGSGMRALTAITKGNQMSLPAWSRPSR